MKIRHWFILDLRMKRLAALIVSLVLVTAAVGAPPQDWIRTGTGLGVEKIRIAVPDFKPAANDPDSKKLATTFSTTLWNDLQAAGIFDMVSASFYPLSAPGTPQDVKLAEWGSPPPNANMLAIGNAGMQNGSLAVQGWLFDVKNAQSPQVLGKQYRESATEDNARVIAHRFADEIIFRLGGGIQGIAESKIYFVSRRGGTKEIWQMDYDGANQKQLTHLGTIALSPHVSPDGSRIAYAGISNAEWQILMYSLELNRPVSFTRFGGTNLSPAWSSDGKSLAFSSSRSGDSEIYVVDVSGGEVRRQIYTMASDGTNVGRMTDQGYAVSPSWSPNGQFLAFAWVRHYGPGAPGASDIYVMDIASKQWVQLTHDGGRNDFPSWSPDGRHIVFQSNRTGKTQVWTMLADGSGPKQLTTQADNSQPNWSSK